jgi:hypothetical protein
MVERYAHVNDAELMRAVRITREHADAAAKGITKGITSAESEAALASGTDGGNS